MTDTPAQSVDKHTKPDRKILVIDSFDSTTPLSYFKEALKPTYVGIELRKGKGERKRNRKNRWS